MISYARFAELREQKHLSDYQLSKESGISATTLYAWKKGTYTPKVDKLAKIAKVLDVPLEELLNLDD